MYIGSVEIKGFRSLSDVSVNLKKYTCLLGKNSSGKSSFLRALHLLFDPTELISDDDYCKAAQDCTEITIEATLHECQPDCDLATDRVVRFQRHCTGKSSKWHYWGNTPISPTLKNMMIGTLNKGAYQSDKALGLEVKMIVNQAIDALTPQGAVPASTWHEAYRRLKEANLIETEVGWCPLAPERLSQFVEVVMLSADARAEEEVENTTKSVMGRVGGMLVRNSTQRHSGMMQAVNQLKEQIAAVGDKLDGQWSLQEMNLLESFLLEEISRFEPNINVTPSLTPPKIPALDFNLKVDISDNYVLGVGKMGHGLRRYVVFSMLRTYLRLEKHRIAAAGGDDNSARPLYLFLMEEPELYLHPQAERRQMKELQELAELPNAQVLLCTHSAFFVDLNAYKGIFRFTRPEYKETLIQGWIGDDLDPNDRETLKMLHYFDPSRAAMLFADMVILVEGQTEKVTVAFLATKLNVDLPSVELVDCGGNGKIPIYQKVLEAFGIRYVAWLDSDRRDEISKVKALRSTELGRIVLTDGDWEHMANLKSKQSDKPFKSWEKYVLNKENPTDGMKACIEAAYGWRDYGDVAPKRRPADNYDRLLHE